MSDSCNDSKMSAILHAYELGMLSGEERDEFEAHLLECEFCFEHIKEFMPRGAILATSPEMRGLPGSGYTEQDRAVSRWQRIRETLWPKGLPKPLRPAVLVSILVLMLYPAYIGIFDGPGDKVAAVEEIGLLQTRSKPTHIIEPHRKVVLSFVCPVSKSSQTYSIVLTGPDGRVIYEEERFRSVDRFRVGRVLLPDHLISPGEYALSVQTLDAAQGDLSLFEYVFEIEYRSPE